MTQKIYIQGNYVLVDVLYNGVQKVYEYPQGRSVYYTRWHENQVRTIELVNTIHNGVTFIQKSDILAGNVVDENNLPYTLESLLALFQQFTGTFVGTNIKQTS